jgi:hypothetical protein
MTRGQGSTTLPSTSCVLAIYRVLNVFQKMINEAVMLPTMALNEVWVKILESQEDARKV